MLGFLFVSDAELVVEDSAMPADKDREDYVRVLDAALVSLPGVDTWATAEIEAALRFALIEGLGLKPRTAFGPLRAAVSGRRISPPLFESMELLGRESTLARVRALRARLAP